MKVEQRNVCLRVILVSNPDIVHIGLMYALYFTPYLLYFSCSKLYQRFTISVSIFVRMLDLVAPLHG